MRRRLESVGVLMVVWAVALTGAIWVGTTAPPASAAPGDVRALALRNVNNSAFSFSIGDNGTGLRLLTHANGFVYAADANDNKIYRIALSTNRVTTFVGTGAACSDQTQACGDGGPATSAQLATPNTVYTDGTNLYIADLFSGRIRRVSLRTNVITTVAGTGTPGFSGDGGAASSAQIGGIIGGMVVTSSGRFYFADTMNEVIRCVGCDGAGVISTVVGTGNAVGSEGVTERPTAGTAATSANLMGPMGLAIEPATGNLVFADACSFAAVFSEGGSYCDSTVWRVNNEGNLEVIAGTPGTVDSSGMGGAATSAALRAPAQIGFRMDGTLLIAEFGATVLGFVAAASGGDLSTVSPAIRCVGCAGAGLTSNWAGGNPLIAANFGARNTSRLSALIGTAYFTSDANGHVYFADQVFNEIRRIEAPLTPPNLKVSFSNTRYSGPRSTTSPSVTREIAVPIRIENKGFGVANGITLTIELKPRTVGGVTSAGLTLSRYTTANAGAFSCTQSGTYSQFLTCTTDTMAARTPLSPAPRFTLFVTQTAAASYTVTATVTQMSADRTPSDGRASAGVNVTR